jgi:hypothetical protein
MSRPLWLLLTHVPNQTPYYIICFCFLFQWIWGSDPTRQQDEKLRKQREVADYNRATVVEHEAQRRAQRHCNDMQDNADEIAFK